MADPQKLRERPPFPAFFALTVGLLAETSGCVSAPSPLTPHASGSVWVPHAGVQTDAVELKKGRSFLRFRPHSRNYWGRPGLVRALQEATAAVDKSIPGGKPLLIGDLSARYGGKIRGHHSHRTGRDVDLLWYVTTPSGVPQNNPGFIRIGSDGFARVQETGEFLRIDVERQWLLVRELMLSPHIRVQWMFCSRDVEAVLIEYARARGEPDQLVWHAESVLLQPGDSLPHDDHIHLRIACSQDESVRGCAGGGPYWPWLPELPRLGALDDSLLTEIATDDPLDTVMDESPNPSVTRGAVSRAQPPAEG